MKKLFLILLCIFLVACATEPPLAIDVAGNEVRMDKQFFERLKASGAEKSVPLERAFDALGYKVVKKIILTFGAGEERIIPWDAASANSSWAGGNSLLVNGKEEQFSLLRVVQDGRMELVDLHTEQIANALLNAMDLPALAGAAQGLELPASPSVVMVFIDGLGYLDLQKAISAGIATVLSSLPTAQLGLSTYPSITRVFTAALLSGLEPLQNGVSYKGGRQLKADTILDVMVQNGKSVILVEGNALYLNDLNDGDLRVSPDSNNDGYTDEETCRAGLNALKQNPDFLWVHLHGVDDAGHESGSFSGQVQERIAYADGCLGSIWNAMPAGGLLLVFSDHGMHTSAGEGRVGEHGTLLAQDRYNFLISAIKP